MSDSTADRTGKGESGIQRNAAQLLWFIGSELLDPGIQLCGAC